MFQPLRTPYNIPSSRVRGLTQPFRTGSETVNRLASVPKPPPQRSSLHLQTSAACDSLIVQHMTGTGLLRESVRTQTQRPVVILRAHRGLQFESSQTQVTGHVRRRRHLTNSAPSSIEPNIHLAFSLVLGRRKWHPSDEQCCTSMPSQSQSWAAALCPNARGILAK